MTPFLQQKPVLMAILNVTPDSFSDGGQFYKGDQKGVTYRRIEAIIEARADMIDIGGESTRPGASPVSLECELERVLPAIEFAVAAGIPVSVDTSRPEVMVEAAKMGASMINDVRALAVPGALEAAAALGLPVCLMHMQGAPKTMQNSPTYHDIVSQVRDFLVDRMRACLSAGMAQQNICLDPGFGFGKTLEHNLELMRQLHQFTELGCPLLIGVSRKSMIGHLLGRDVDDRLPGSLAFAMAALYKGARILRVHDVRATRDMIDVFCALQHLVS